MRKRREIREAVVQFLYGFDLEGGADPSQLRDSFWNFVNESDRRSLLTATWKTIHHLQIGRDERKSAFRERLPVALAALRAEPTAEAAVRQLERVAELEERWGEDFLKLSRVKRDDEDDAVTRNLGTAIEALFRTDRDLARARGEFLQRIDDLPKLRGQLEPVAGSLRRLQRISDRLRMIEEPEKYPEHTEFQKLRQSKESMDSFRRTVDELSDAVLGHKERIDRQLEEVIDNFAPERIDPVDRAILRLGAYEILFDPEVPAAVAINEAIELAKRFGTSDSGRFVNGVLDRIAKDS